jgi:aldehyde dehydrogenase (NAD+)
MSDYKMYIGGEWVEAASGKSFETIDPSTGKPFATIARGDREDAAKAIDAAYEAHRAGTWRSLPGEKRAELLEQVAQGILANSQKLAQLESQDSGGTIRKAQMADVTGAASAFRFFARMARELPDEEPLERHQMPIPSRNYVRREPYGVCAGIVPWNFPLLMAAWKIAPAIAAGNTVVLKPASYTSLTALELARIIDETDIPKGVVNVVPGPGGAVGEELASNPKVAKVAFTGSTEVGRRIMQLASSTVKKCTLELGGKSPALVTDDADLDLAASGVLWGTFFHCGQVCESGTRALVYSSVYDDFVSLLADRAGKLNIGPATQLSTDLGPLVSAQQLETVERYVAIGKEEGAKLVCGGRRAQVDGHEGGYYYEPTIFADVDNSMKIAQEEIFGPVLSVIKVENDDHAIEVANDTIYGLAGAVWCRDLERAERLASRIEAGTIWINDHHLINPEYPFGGYKQSGIGRELGKYGYDEYRQIKHVHVDQAGEKSKHIHFGLLSPSLMQ